MKAYVLTDGSIQYCTTKPLNSRIEIPADVDKSDYPYVKAQQVDGIWEVYVDEVMKAATLAGLAKKQEVEKLIGDYGTEVDDELLNQYGTKDQVRALFLYLTYARMADHPEEFSDKGLVDDNGVPLDTNTKVYDFARVKIMKATDYSVFVLKRLKKLEDDIASL